LILATGFDTSICHCVGTYDPEAGCGYCYQGICRIRRSGGRFGGACVDIDRFGVPGEHQGIVTVFPSVWPYREVWSGVSHRIPPLRWVGDPRPPAWIELLQCTSAPYSWPTEVILLPDRRIGLQVFHYTTDPDPVIGSFVAPEDEWFTTVLHAASGHPARQELFVYDGRGALVDHLSGDWITDTDTVHDAVRQKCGGDQHIGLAPGQNVTSHDDWWIASSNLGPYHVTEEIRRSFRGLDPEPSG